MSSNSQARITKASTSPQPLDARKQEDNMSARFMTKVKQKNQKTGSKTMKGRNKNGVVVKPLVSSYMGRRAQVNPN